MGTLINSTILIPLIPFFTSLFIFVLLVSFNRTLNRLTKPVTALVALSLLSSAFISSIDYFQKIEKDYTPGGFEVIDTRLKQKVTDARKELADANTANEKALQVSDKVHLKAVGDFMVDGRLVRESKVALMFTPLTIALTLGAAGVLYYGFLQGGSTTRTVSGNKSAAMAVFG